jgi:hypothetical protein
MAELVLGAAKFKVNIAQLRANCPKFKNPKLLPYRVQSAVSEAAFRVFLSALDGEEAAITAENVDGLSLLCEEFEFGALLSRVSAVKMRTSVVDEEARRRIGCVEEQTIQQDRTLCFLQEEIVELRAACSEMAKRIQELSQSNNQRKREIAALEQREGSPSSFRSEIEAQMRFLAESNRAQQGEIAAVRDSECASSERNLSLERELCQLQEEIEALGKRIGIIPWNTSPYARAIRGKLQRCAESLRRFTRGRGNPTERASKKLQHFRKSRTVCARILCKKR